MIYKVQRFSSIDSPSRPIILDLKQVERKLYESGLSKREVDIIIDGLRGCDDPEEIMKWVKTGKVNNPKVQKIMEETGLSFPAAYIESEERLYSKNKKVIKKLREEAKDYEDLSRSKKLALLNDSAAKIDSKSGEYYTNTKDNRNKLDIVERHYITKSLVNDKQSSYSLVDDYKKNLDWYKSDFSKNQNKEIIEELKNKNPEKEVDSWNTHHKISEAGRKYQVKKLKKSIKKDIKRATLENEHPKLAALKSTLFSVTNNPINRFKRAYQEQRDYLQDEGNRKSIKEEISKYQKGNDPEEIKKRYLKYHPDTDLENKEAKKGMGEMKKAGDWMIKRGESDLNHPKRQALKHAVKNWRNYSDINKPKSIPPHINGKDEKSRYIQILDPETYKSSGPKIYFNNTIQKEKNFSLLSGIKNWMDKENKRLNKIHGIKTREEIERERQREKQQQDVQRIENFCNFSKQHQILFDIDKKTKKYYPSWGDGDEYPCLHLDLEEGNFDLGFQHGPWYSWKKKYWEKDSEDFGIQKIYNLKQSILRDIDIEIKDWKTIDYLEDSDIEEVLDYLKVLKSEIQRSRL